MRGVGWRTGTAVLLLLVSGGAMLAQRWGVRPGGGALAQLAPEQTHAVLLFFVATDCPVSNRMFPEMQRLREAFQPRGVQTWFVYPNTTETQDGILVHQRAFDAGGRALQDPAGELVRLTSAVATPEMAVLVPASGGWRTVYAGRIDDKFVHLGLERPKAKQHEGEDALRAVLAGRTPRAPGGRPVGCAILSPGMAR